MTADEYANSPSTAALALEWYKERAASLARYWSAKPPNTEAAIAIMTELSLDAGNRARVALRALAAPQEAEDQRGVHGETCRKAPHTNPSGEYLHAADDDSAYDVDGVRYCGRCHYAL